MKAEDWKPIETAEAMKLPMDPMASYPVYPSILVWSEHHVYVAQWDDNRYAKKPRPFWSMSGVCRSQSRAAPPTFWMKIVPPEGD
jgi:hypothetical protein